MSCVSCCNYSKWKLLAWWFYIQSGLSFRCNSYVVVVCGCVAHLLVWIAN